MAKQGMGKRGRAEEFLVVLRSWGRRSREGMDTGVGGGEWGDREEVGDGGGGGNQIWYAVDTSRGAVTLRVRSTIQLTCNCDQRYAQYG